MSEIVIPRRTERSLFSLHEEEVVVETPPHRRQVVYIETNLQADLPHLFVGANLGVYWVPDQYEEPWVGPDVLVSQRALEKPPERIYLVWEEGPIRFVAEVASEWTRRGERRKREQVYREALQVPEYLYVDLERHQLHLWRLQGSGYRRVPEESGRLYSEQLGVWFGWDPDQEFVRIWTADGRMLLTKEEEAEQRQAAELRALAAEADRDAALQAEAQAVEQARGAEARAAELAAELERLRRASREAPSS